MDKGQLLSSSFTSVWRLGLIAVIMLVLALSIGKVFVSKQDIRNSEASILANKISECLSGSGTINSDFELGKCYAESPELYVSANLASIESNFSRFAETGNNAINVFCKLKEQGQDENSASCISQKYYVLINHDSKTEGGLLELTTGVKKYESNI